MSEDDDPTVIRSLAIHANDVVAALVASEQGAETVLRVTPPFNGRMRARIHRVGPGGVTDGRDEETGAFHISPDRLVEASAPRYPRAVDTEPDGEYDVESHHERHVDAVEEWRETVREHLADSVELSTPDGQHEVDVAVLG
ncbi:hypothetical protein [Haloarchaeobius litoreus]|uniref:DUF8009 domain-containing protein n=1 Tax=Haloarchaeobius litoreus TaxID=755306 RepID=A0ABD6DJY1_9EURY